MTMRDEVRIHVRVAPEQVEVALLRRAVDAFADFLRGSGRGTWIVSQLNLASITTAARPAPGSDLDVDAEFRRITDGLAVLAEAAVAPFGWSDEMLAGVAALGGVAEMRGVEAIELTLGEASVVTVPAQTCENARRALENGPTALGAVTGEVDRFYSRSGRREFGLVDEATGDTVTVRFSRQHEDDVRHQIGQRVTAWGQLRRSPGGKKKELRMEGFEVVPPISELRVDDIVGILRGDWTEGLSSVDWIRSQRDDD